MTAIQILSRELDRRIEQFEAYLALFPYQNQQCIVDILDPYAYQVKGYIRFVAKRKDKGGVRVLRICFRHEPQINDLGWVNICDGSLRIKSLSVKAFPILMHTMLEAHNTLLPTLENAIQTYDTFSKEINLESDMESRILAREDYRAQAITKRVEEIEEVELPDDLGNRK